MAEHSDAQEAARLATLAGELLIEIRRTSGLEGKELKDEGDRRSHELLMRELAASRPDDAVLSEEGADDLARLSADRVWIVDPVDGTREYGEGREDWAVHVALWSQGELVAGAVARPAAGVTHSTDETHVAEWSGPSRIRLAVSRSRPPAFVTALAEALDAELVPMGSAGVKAMSVVTDEADAYVHAGGQFEWDSAAPVAVCRAAHLHTSRIDGSPLVYNSHDPKLPDLVIARPEVAERILKAIATIGDAEAPTSA